MSIIACTECQGVGGFEYEVDRGRLNSATHPIPDYRHEVCSHCKGTRAEPCEFCGEPSEFKDEDGPFVCQTHHIDEDGNIIDGEGKIIPPVEVRDTTCPHCGDPLKVEVQGTEIRRLIGPHHRAGSARHQKLFDSLLREQLFGEEQ